MRRLLKPEMFHESAAAEYMVRQKRMSSAVRSPSSMAHG